MNREEVAQLARKLKAKIIETHISWVLLCDKTVYKIKKPIKTSFLNYSTLLRRKRMCEEEVRLNSEFSKKIYEGVVPVTMDEGKPSLMEGRIIDYAVKMKRLDSSKQLDVMVLKRVLDEHSIQRLAEVIAIFHKRAAVSHVKKYNYLSDQFWDLYYVLKKAESLNSIPLDNPKEPFELVDQYLDKHQLLFRRREKGGWVRDLHGDLHAANIFIYKSNPLLVDRIEFNEQFRLVDVLHELAFLYMDMEALGRKEWSELLLTTYLKKTKFEMNWPIFAFYKAYAANIRAKVYMLGYLSSGKRRLLVKFKKYFSLMLKYVRDLRKGL